MAPIASTSDWLDPVVPPNIEEHDAAYVIGDVHGRWDLLSPALRHINASATNDSNPLIVSLGDLIDRGPHGLRCVDAIYSDDRIVCLPGNHEQMMLAFLESGDREIGALWIGNGGHAVLNEAEDLVDENRLAGPDGSVERMQTLLRSALGRWYDKMRALTPYLLKGNALLVHAGVPQGMLPTNIPPDYGWQSERSMRRVMEGREDESPLWVRYSFLYRQDTPWEDGVIVVHGHTIMREPVVRSDRISIDTGAARPGGTLTVLEIREGRIRFHGFTAHADDR